MTKDKKMEFRANEEFSNKINILCDKLGMNKSELFRYSIENLDSEKGNATALIARHVFNLSSIVNSINECGITKEKLDTLTKEANSIWQYLS